MEQITQSDFKVIILINQEHIHRSTCMLMRRDGKLESINFSKMQRLCAGLNILNMLYISAKSNSIIQIQFSYISYKGVLLYLLSV